MRFAGYDFRPRLLPTIATVCMMALTFAAGRWQLGRADEKAALQARFEQNQALAPIDLNNTNGDLSELRYRALAVDGEFIPGKQVYIDNREHEGKSGYHVIAAFQIFNSNRVILINRGWIQRGRDYPKAPDVVLPVGRVKIVGTGSVPSARFVELSDQAIAGNVWQNLTFERASSALALPVLPIVVLQQQGLSDGLSAVIEQPNFKIDMHRGYAFQWFALTATLMVIYVVVNTKRRTA
jgi:surfeit locus 1 family protein